MSLPTPRPGRYREAGSPHTLLILDIPVPVPGMVMVAREDEPWETQPELRWRAWEADLTLVDGEKTLRNLQARLDRLAIEQLRAEVARLDAENHRLSFELEETERELRWADDAARMWQEDFQRLEESLAPDQSIGLTKTGALVLMTANPEARPS